MHSDARQLRWDRGEATLQSLGAMLAPVTFRLPGGREVQPMHVATWAGSAESGALPGVLRALRGEWPCVPFGVTPDAAPADWPQGLHADPDEAPHGYGSNQHWTLRMAPDGALLADIDYPATSPVAGLQRRVASVAGQTRLEIELTVHVRRSCRLPIGLHPTFRLPEETGAARLDPGPHAEVWTYPLDVSPTVTLFEPDRRGGSLEAVPAMGGGVVDATRLPFAQACENLLMLTGCGGRAALDNLSERYRVVLQWNASHFPSLMLWMSNRGRQFPPWNGRHQALGVEPVCAPFDLGSAFAAADTPLSRAGVATGMDLRPDAPFTTRYSISVEELLPQ